MHCRLFGTIAKTMGFQEVCGLSSSIANADIAQRRPYKQHRGVEEETRMKSDFLVNTSLKD